MNVQFLSYRTLDEQGREIIMAKLRTSLIALKHFEQYYILARWLRILWNDIFDRSASKTMDEQVTPPAHTTPKVSTINYPAQNALLMQPATETVGISSYAQTGGLNYSSGECLEPSPYSIPDLSNLVFSWDQEANPALQLATQYSMDFEGLQFLADLRLAKESTHSDFSV